MFKKTLLAAALSIVAINASAIDMGATNSTLSVEGVAAGNLGATKEVDALVVVATLGAEYTVGDTVTFTVAGGTFADTGYTLVSQGVEGGGLPEVITWGLLNATTTELTFRATNITSGTGTGLTAGQVYDLEGAASQVLEIKVTSIAKAGTVTITSDARTSTGIAIDVSDDPTTAANEDAAVVATGVKQLTAVVTAGAAKVDVGDDRESFVVAGSADFSIAYGETAATNADVTLATTDVVITGDFTGVKSLTECGLDTDCALAADNVAVVIAEDEQTAKMTLTGAARNLAFEYTLPSVAADIVALTAPQTFTADLTAKYEVNDALLAAKAVSVWTLNGSSDGIALMPFGSQYAQSITVANTGSVEGAITVDLTANGTTFTKTLTAVAAKKSVTNISLEVAAFAAESGIEGNARVLVVVNAPDGDIDVVGVYYHKADGDRVLTYNNQQP